MPKADILILIAGRLGAALIALLTLRAVTTFLLPGQYGELALLIALQMFCGLVLINPVGQHINLHTHAWWDEGSLWARLKKYRLYVLGVACIGAVITFGLGIRHPNLELLANCFAVFFMVLFATWNATLVSMLNMLGFRGASVLWTIATAAVGAAASIVLVFWHPTGIAWFLGQCIGMAVGAFGAHLALAVRTPPAPSTQRAPTLFERSTISTYLVPLAMATVMMWLQLSGYRFIVEWKWGLTRLGLLALGLQLAAQIWGLVESFSMQFLYPSFYRRINDDKTDAGTMLAMSDLLNTIAPVYLVLAGFIVAGAPNFMKLLVAPQYFESIKFLYLGAVIELCRGLANVMSNAAQAKHATGTLVFPYAIGALLTIGMIQLMDSDPSAIEWVGVAMLAGVLGMAWAMYIGMRRLVRFRIDCTRWCAAVAVMLFLGTTSRWGPSLSGVLPNIAMLLILSAFVSITLTALLRGNPAVTRLLGVNLKGI